jgi:hypothetical protein
MRRASFGLAVLLLAAACGSGGLGGLGDLGGILGSPSSDTPSDVRGVVAAVNTGAQRIDLDTQYINNLRDERRNQTIYYDNDTRVVFEGRDYAVTDLERGDEIAVRGVTTGGRYVAQTIEVVRDVSR